MLNIFLVFLLLIYSIFSFENYDNKKLIFTDKENGNFYNLKPILNIPFQSKFQYTSNFTLDLSFSWSIGEEGNNYCKEKMNNEENAKKLNPSACFIKEDNYVIMLAAKPNELALERLRYGVGLVARFKNDLKMSTCKTAENHDVIIEIECDSNKNMTFLGCKFQNEDIRCPGITCSYKSNYGCPTIHYQEIESKSFYEKGVLFTDKIYRISNFMYEIKQFNVTTDFHLKDPSKGIIGFNTIATGLYRYDILISKDYYKEIQFTMVGDSKPTLFFNY
ncbi:hypothetical protein DICPUDRAFT_84396 [Dictyostelium purpureum]|uniref:Uncharacterized protein n=1 Tax=Dictyostelium purpureum TaxID=5786 RepID=F1A2I6_DICPU|nr:uncharacterized protein DICPUDRAFT_84396 [Dictyostelium purpureum]EGC29597.1 hypothetical protein DICPUDRAFT_84396 [Dictyostelium purpureum]|eukprot:XP_003293881.1 hypothetical protein DICPUDRAFT_84396 [Dictyostelium purpureum]